MESINRSTHSWCENHNVPSYFLDSIDSTNSWAKSFFKETDLIAVFLTDHQTAGRGRGGRTWTNSETGSTLLSTWCLRLEQTPQPVFAIRCGLMLWEALQSVWPGVPWAMKAPNDIYVDLGKFAGILIEVEQGLNNCNAFIGIGANIHSAPSGIDQTTFTLAGQPGVDIASTWPAFCNQFVKGLFELRKDAHRSLLTGREIDRLKTALSLYPKSEIQDVLPDGGLCLKNNDRIHWSEL
jgi:BirA family biotin operon repressor/biotin-[acetyl-CoA-carboxylase] ligase